MHRLGESSRHPHEVSGGPVGNSTEFGVGRQWQLVRLHFDGSIAATFPITREVTEIGRRARDITEPDDIHMADHHASLVYESGEFFIADSGEGSGVWLRLDAPDGLPLADEDQIWLGAQVLVAAKRGKKWSLLHYGEDGRRRGSLRVDEAGIFVGRDSDHELDPDDGMLSRRHAQFRVEAGQLKIYDRGARNGTFIKVSGATALVEGSEFRASTTAYRLEGAVRRVR